MLVDEQSELMSDLLFTVHQHGGDDATWKPPIHGHPRKILMSVSGANHALFSLIIYYCFGYGDG